MHAQIRLPLHMAATMVKHVTELFRKDCVSILGSEGEPVWLETSLQPIMSCLWCLSEE